RRCCCKPIAFSSRSHHLHSRLHRRSNLPVLRRQSACPLHVVHIADVTTQESELMHNIAKVFCVAVAPMLGPAAAHAQSAPLKMIVSGQLSVNNDAIWMAIENGFYQQEGLDVTYRLFPSGTTAFQAFQPGQGDIVMTGDLPSVQYFFRVKGD